MKSVIPLAMAAIFFSSEPLSETGYWLGYVMVDLILHGLTRPVRSANQELQNEKFLSAEGFEPGTMQMKSTMIYSKLWLPSPVVYHCP